MGANLETRTVSKGRLSWFRVLTVLFGVASGLGLFGWIYLFGGWFFGGDELIHRVHNIGGSGVLVGILVSVGFLAPVRRPDRMVAPLQQVFAASAATLVAALLALDGAFVLYAVIVAVPATIVTALDPARGDVIRPRARFSPVLAGLVALGAVPLVWFALTMARLQRTGFPSDTHVQFHHWAGMAAMALAILAVGLVATLRTRGWRVSAWCAGLGLFVYGLASAIFADFEGTGVPYPGSEGVGWGVAAMAGGALFILAAEWEARRTAAEGAP
jgi:hypothetical protein